MKQPAITTSSVMMKASSLRKPRCWSSRISSTSKAVRQMPQTSGSPNSSCNAMAVPITSARSHATIASSHITQSRKPTGRL